MLSKRDLILPIAVVLLLASLPVWYLANYLDDFLFYRSLQEDGKEAIAVLARKGVVVGNRLKFANTTEQSDDHQFIVKYKTDNNELVACQLGVSKRTYDVVTRRDQINVAYLPSNPARCTLPASISSMYYMSSSVLILAAFFIILAFGFVYYIYDSFRKPADPVKLTTNLDFGNNEVFCPKCGNSMLEGYMPTVGGVSWRERDEAVGIPTILNGLPGTTLWVKRPLLHSYHCKECRIITFKYGKDQPDN